MKDLQIFYKNKKGINLEIVGAVNQYIFLEPQGSAVIRYTIKDGGVEVGGKISNEVKETDVVSVKFRTPDSEFLSKKSDFDDIPPRTGKTLSLPLEFDNGICLYDALFTNLTNEKIKVKVSAYDVADTIVENEYSYVDAPDGFIRSVGIIIDSTGVEYTLLFRRSGRVFKHPGKASFEQMAQVVKDVFFAQERFYSRVPKPTYRFIPEPTPQSILDALTLEGWVVSTSSIARMDRTLGAVVQITDEELGKIIKNKITTKDLANLFKPADLNNGHRLIDNVLTQPCDSACSLPEVTAKNIIDNRL